MTWAHGDTRVTLRQETRFPESDEVTLRLSLSRADSFALKLRQPAWLAGPMAVRVNDKAVDAPGDEGATVLGFLTGQQLDPSNVVVEYNRKILKQAELSGTVIHKDDTLEILRFVGGG